MREHDTPIEASPYSAVVNADRLAREIKHARGRLIHSEETAAAMAIAKELEHACWLAKHPWLIGIRSPKP